MPITKPRRRLEFLLAAGAIVALSALAVPTAASAAEACAPGTTPTAQTQPWLDFAGSPNQYVPVEAAYAAMIPAISGAVSLVDADFTQVEYDALNTAIGTAFQGAGTASNAALDVFSDQMAALSAGLQASDSANQVANEAIISGWGDAHAASQYGLPLNTAFTTFLSEIGSYLASVQAAITANTPRPTPPASLTDALAALGAGIAGIGDFVQVTYYDAAAAQVVCALPATGASSDPGPTTIGGGVLLLVGAGLAIAAMRRRETAAA